MLLSAFLSSLIKLLVLLTLLSTVPSTAPAVPGSWEHTLLEYMNEFEWMEEQTAG